RASEWYGDVTRVRWNRQQPVAVGSRLAFIAEFLGRESDYIYEVTEHVPEERFAMSRAEGPFPMETAFSWEDLTGGRTRMTIRSIVGDSSATASRFTAGFAKSTSPGPSSTVSPSQTNRARPCVTT